MRGRGTSLERFTAATEALDPSITVVTEELTITVYDTEVQRWRGPPRPGLGGWRLRPTIPVPAVLITVSRPYPLSRLSVQALFDPLSGAYIGGVTHARGPQNVRSNSAQTPSQPFGWKGDPLHAILERLATWPLTPIPTPTTA